MTIAEAQKDFPELPVRVHPDLAAGTVLIAPQGWLTIHLPTGATTRWLPGIYVRSHGMGTTSEK